MIRNFAIIWNDAKMLVKLQNMLFEWVFGVIKIVVMFLDMENHLSENNIF